MRLGSIWTELATNYGSRLVSIWTGLATNHGMRLGSIWTGLATNYGSRLVSLWTGLATTTVYSLRGVIKAAVRIDAGLGHLDHGTEQMKKFHWVPIKYRINFKFPIEKEIIRKELG